MTKEGNYIVDDLKFAVVVSRFNCFVTEKLLEGAIDCLKRHGCEDQAIDVVKVPGSFEIPVTALHLANSKQYHAVICLGTIIRGKTAHFDHVASEAAKGIGAVALQTGIPTVFGILTTDSLEDAIDRAGAKSGNKGWDAALTAIEMANLMKKIS